MARRRRSLDLPAFKKILHKIEPRTIMPDPTRKRPMTRGIQKNDGPTTEQIARVAVLTQIGLIVANDCHPLPYLSKSPPYAPILSCDTQLSWKIDWGSNYFTHSSTHLLRQQVYKCRPSPIARE